MLTKRGLARLQRRIDKTVAAANRHIVAQTELLDWCREYYGFEPGDVDADYIIDGLGAGGGMAGNLSAEDFDQIMENNR